MGERCEKLLIRNRGCSEASNRIPILQKQAGQRPVKTITINTPRRIAHDDSLLKHLPSLRQAEVITTQAASPEPDTLSTLIPKILQIDPSNREARLTALRSVCTLITEASSILSDSELSLLVKLICHSFSSNLPFAILHRGCHHLYSNPCEEYEDVTLCYRIYDAICVLNYPYPDDLIRILVKRLTSASHTDRSRGKTILLDLPNCYREQALRHSINLLIPAPPHGGDCLLDYISHLLQHILISPELARLELALHNLHFAPNFSSFTTNLTETLKSLHNIDPKYAHTTRLFILNNWPRADPSRAVLFLDEATAICVHGPPIDPHVWQRFAYRASSIHHQLANAGMSFIEQTIGRMTDVDLSVLKYLVEEAAKGHWYQGVRDKAAELVKVLGAIEAVAPDQVAIDTWSSVKRMAHERYPADFGGARKIRRLC
jgi:hypothetical protein